MAYQHGAAGGVWKPGARAASAIGRALDMMVPPQALDGTGRPQSSGLSAEAAGELLEAADAVAPAPLRRWRLLGRRYNQAAEIARPLARRWGAACLPDALVRSRPTASQGGMSGAGRRRNVAGACSVTEAGRRRIAGSRILLVDEVLTMGAAAEACARALLKAGAAAVDLAVAARVRETPSASI